MSLLATAQGREAPEGEVSKRITAHKTCSNWFIADKRSKRGGSFGARTGRFESGPSAYHWMQRILYLPQRLGSSLIPTTTTLSNTSKKFNAKNTTDDTQKCLKLFSEWKEERNTVFPNYPVPQDILQGGNNVELCKWFSKFATEVRQKDGSSYLPLLFLERC